MPPALDLCPIRFGRSRPMPAVEKRRRCSQRPCGIPPAMYAPKAVLVAGGRWELNSPRVEGRFHVLGRLVAALPATDGAVSAVEGEAVTGGGIWRASSVFPSDDDPAREAEIACDIEGFSERDGLKDNQVRPVFYQRRSIPEARRGNCPHFNALLHRRLRSGLTTRTLRPLLSRSMRTGRSTSLAHSKHQCFVPQKKDTSIVAGRCPQRSHICGHLAQLTIPRGFRYDGFTKAFSPCGACRAARPFSFSTFESPCRARSP